MGHDLRQAFRTLVRHPGFLALAAGVLALGIGLNTALFSSVYAMLYRPFPVTASHELVSLYLVHPRQPDRPLPWLTSDLHEHFARHSEIFTGLTGHVAASYAMRADDQVESVRAEAVLANYFAVLGVSAAAGRTFVAAEDDRATTDRAVVLSHRLWMRRFAGDPSVVGKEVRLALYGRPEFVYTVVGSPARASRASRHPGSRRISGSQSRRAAGISSAGDSRSAPSDVSSPASRSPRRRR